MPRRSGIAPSGSATLEGPRSRIPYYGRSNSFRAIDVRQVLTARCSHVQLTDADPVLLSELRVLRTGVGLAIRDTEQLKGLSEPQLRADGTLQGEPRQAAVAGGQYPATRMQFTFKFQVPEDSLEAQFSLFKALSTRRS